MSQMMPSSSFYQLKLKVKFNQYLTNPYQYVTAFYCLHVFLLIFIIEVFIIFIIEFIIKVTVERELFCLKPSKKSCYNVKSLENLYFKPYILITLAKKRDNVDPYLDLLCIPQSDTAPFCENYAKFYFDVKHLEKGLNRGGEIFGAPALVF